MNSLVTNVVWVTICRLEVLNMNEVIILLTK